MWELVQTLAASSQASTDHHRVTTELARFSDLSEWQVSRSQVN